MQFDYSFICQFLVFRLHYSGSLSYVLSARSAIAFHLKLVSDSPCPTESPFVTSFVKGLQRKFKTIPRTAFAISYSELSVIFSNIVGDSDIENLSFVNLRFITFILTLYSSFPRYEELCNLTLSDVEQEESVFVLNFLQGKSYQFGESNIGVVSDLPNLTFNPAKVFPFI